MIKRNDMAFNHLLTFKKKWGFWGGEFRLQKLLYYTECGLYVI